MYYNNFDFALNRNGGIKMGIDRKLELLQQARASSVGTKAYERLEKLFDEGTFVEIDGLAKSGSGYAEAAAGFGTVEGCPAYAFVQNCDIAGGAMSRAQAAKIRKVFDLAVKTGAPVVGVYDSIGARLQEGADMLEAYGEMLLNSSNLSGVVPQISVVLGPCLGTSALIASSADLVVMAKGAQFGVETDGTAADVDAAAKTGLAHLVTEDEDSALQAARNLLTMLPSNNLSVAPVSEVQGEGAADALRSAAERIESGDGDVSRSIIRAAMDENSFIELQPDYGAGFAVGLARLSGSTVGVLASCRGVENGIIDADTCAKAARFVRFCDAFALPVVTFVDSTRFASLKEAVKLVNAYAEATTVKVTVITGEAYGPVYVAVAGKGANADLTFAWPTAVISALAPETAAAILWSDRLKGSSNPIEDRKNLAQEYAETEASPLEAAAGGFVDDVIEPAETRAKLLAALDLLAGKRVARLPKKHANIQL
jgi:acetyl-CoA carboxylase carboxyltransferase component